MDVWTGRPLALKRVVAANLAGLCSDGRTDGRTIRTGGSQRNDALEKQKRQFQKQICFSALSKLQSSNPRPESLAGVRSDGRMNERTIRTEGSKRNDVLEKQKRQFPKQIYFSAFSKLQNSNPRPESPFRWTNGRSDGSDRRSIERRDGQTFRALSPQAFGSVERTERTNGRTGGRMNAA